MKKTYIRPQVGIYTIQATHMMAASDTLDVLDNYSGGDALSGEDALVRKHNSDLWDQKW